MNVRRLLSLCLATASLAAPARADQITIRYPQGAGHAFLVIRSESGTILGYGEDLQLVHGDRITARLTLHFKDGSLDDETTIYTQHQTFHLVSDHHIQRGPFFSKPIDATVDETGQVTMRSTDKDNKLKVETNHLDLPPDLSNGFIGTLLLNIRLDTQPFKISELAPTGKGRLIQLSISPAGTETFSPVVGVRRKAAVFRIHPELGGVVGVIAPIIGKQPQDVFVWVLQGDVPGIVREIGQLAEGGPVVSIEPAGTSYPPAAAIKK